MLVRPERSAGFPEQPLEPVALCFTSFPLGLLLRALLSECSRETSSLWRCGARRGATLRGPVRLVLGGGCRHVDGVESRWLSIGGQRARWIGLEAAGSRHGGEGPRHAAQGGLR